MNDRVRRSVGWTLVVLAGVVALAAAGVASEARQARNERRAYDGAPPTIPHESFGIDCVACHGAAVRVDVDEVGTAPANPHREGDDLGHFDRCVQCHVFQSVTDEFRGSTFEPWRYDPARAAPAYPGSPPAMPHPAFMRESCLACHGSGAADEAMRTSHPERLRCRQCHLEPLTGGSFP